MRADPPPFGHPDAAAAAAQDGLFGALPAGADGAGLRRRLAGWLGRLSRIGADLVERLGAMTDARKLSGTAADGVDLGRGWALVSRAVRWTRALQARLRAVAAAARVRRLRTRPVNHPVSLLGINSWGPGIRAPKEPHDDCTDGMKADEVVAQICADLDEAATLTHDGTMTPTIARIAAAARALLAGPAETWTKRPPPVWRGRVPHAPDPGPPDPGGPDAPAAPCAPDSG